MRSPPPPALKNVMVARPGANPGVVARRDNLLTAAVFAAEESHEPRASRPLSVLARVHRRVSRWGDSLRRKARHDRRAPRQLVQSHHVAFDRNGNAASPPSPPPQSDSTSSNLSDALASQVLLHRERILRMEREKRDRDLASLTFDDIDEDEHHDERAVSSLREPWSRRVRQVGAREDDDTLLMLPRVSSISFTAAGEPAAAPPPKVRQLPRLSGLMPTRASPRSPSSPISSASPVSSTTRSTSTASSARTPASNPHPVQTPDNRHPSPFAAHSPHPAMYRLPTALNNRDVEREMQQAIVEVASESASSTSDTDSPPPISPRERRIPGFNFDVTNGRVMSDVHHEMRIPRSQPFVRRANSSLYATATESEEDDVDANQESADSLEQAEERPFFRSLEQANHVTRKKKTHRRSYEMYEDDYLSFQGFRTSSSERPHHHQSMSSLLRSKRISAVTDSPSEDSAELTRPGRGISRRGKGRNAFLAARRHRRHHSLSARTTP